MANERIIQMLQGLRDQGHTWRKIGQMLCVDPSEASAIYTERRIAGKKLERRYLDSYAAYRQKERARLHPLIKSGEHSQKRKKSLFTPRCKWRKHLPNEINTKRNTTCWRYMAEYKGLDTIDQISAKTGLGKVRIYGILIGAILPKAATLAKHGMMMGLNATQVVWILREFHIDAKSWARGNLTAAQYKLLFNESKDL